MTGAILKPTFVNGLPIEDFDAAAIGPIRHIQNIASVHSTGLALHEFILIGMDVEVLVSLSLALVIPQKGRELVPSEDAIVERSEQLVRLLDDLALQLGGHVLVIVERKLRLNLFELLHYLVPNRLLHNSVF